MAKVPLLLLALVAVVVCGSEVFGARHLDQSQALSSKTGRGSVMSVDINARISGWVEALQCPAGERKTSFGLRWPRCWSECAFESQRRRPCSVEIWGGRTREVSDARKAMPS